MGCHTWFYSSQDKLDKQLTTEFHDVFRESGFPEIILGSYDETIDYIRDDKCVVFDYTDEYLKRFWNKYPDGKIEFG